MANLQFFREFIFSRKNKVQTLIPRSFGCVSDGLKITASFLQQSWKWNITILDTKLILQGHVLHYSDCEEDYVPNFSGVFYFFSLRGCSGHLKKDGVPESMEEPNTIRAPFFEPSFWNMSTTFDIKFT